MPSRRRLPTRREGENITLTVDGIRCHCTVNDGEVFIAGPKPGSPVSMILNDVAVLISVAIQTGVPIEALAKSIARDKAGKPASVVGAVLDLAERAETQASVSPSPEATPAYRDGWTGADPYPDLAD